MVQALKKEEQNGTSLTTKVSTNNTIYWLFFASIFSLLILIIMNFEQKCHFTLERLLGEGVSSRVYQSSYNMTADRQPLQCAIKVMRLDTESHRERIMELHKNEVDALQSCPLHPNIIRLYGIGEESEHRRHTGSVQKTIFQLQELAPHGELFQYAQLDRFDDQTIRFYARQLFEGIKHMKEHGYAHRDIKAENVVLDAHFNAKIIDWGFATPY